MAIALRDRFEETPLLGLLHREALHGADAGQDLGPAAEGAGPVREQLAVAPGLLGRRAHADQRGQGREDAHRQGEPPIQLEQRGQRQRQVRERGQRFERQFRHGRDEAVDRCVHPADGGAHGLALVVVEGQFVQPRRHALAQREIEVEPHAPAARLELAREVHLHQLGERQPAQGKEHGTNGDRGDGAWPGGLGHGGACQHVDQLHDGQRRRGRGAGQQQRHDQHGADPAAEAVEPGQGAPGHYARGKSRYCDNVDSGAHGFNELWMSWLTK
jgi:hypothetical protein